MNRSSSRIWHQRYIFGWTRALNGQHSYIYVQPVKVVSSMGQQSVGKSFSLNHLLDTSFAGSAMRTTGIVTSTPMITRVCTKVNRGRMVVCNTHRRCTYSGTRLRRSVRLTSERHDWSITQIAGVDSVERSLQEDTLFVLFNTAISNLVCQQPLAIISF